MAKFNILELSKINQEDVKNSSNWFNEQVKRLSSLQITSSKLMNGQQTGLKMVNKLVPGRLYFFYYDPKLKEELPYYDRFPLVLPFGKEQGSFRGLNLHYLDYKMRMALFNELLRISGNTNLTELTKIKYSWATVKSIAKLAPAQACVKMYLEDHLRSPYCEISPEFWHTAIMLPVQKFVGASAQKVWQRSSRYRALP